MKKLPLILIALSSFNFSFAQTEEQKVAAVVNQLFTSMFNGDSIGVTRCFTDKSIMQSITLLIRAGKTTAIDYFIFSL